MFVIKDTLINNRYAMDTRFRRARVVVDDVEYRGNSRVMIGQLRMSGKTRRNWHHVLLFLRRLLHLRNCWLREITVFPPCRLNQRISSSSFNIDRAKETVRQIGHPRDIIT